MIRSRAGSLVLALAVFAGASGAVHSPEVTAQVAKVEIAAGDDLRSVFANAADVAEGKRVAESVCASCHSTNGVSSMKGVPNLAGQRSAYLYTELRAYQAGARTDAAMGAAVKFLNNDALLKVAAYYGSLEPAQPAATTVGKSAPASLDAVQAGKAATAPCSGCHGETGVSKVPGTPSLVGLDPKYLVTAMKAYKSGQRKNDVMKSMLATVGEAELSNISLYYALQKPARAQASAPADQAAGKTADAMCSGCHGDNGVSGNPAIPSLAGQDAQYLMAAIRAYRDGSRSDETMKGLAASLDEAATKNLSAFYANKQAQPPKVTKPLTAAEWAQRCDRCHGVDGNSADPRLPALAAQRADYLEKVLHAYRTGERKSPQMAAMSEALTDGDVENLAAYYSRKKARSVVYVILPAK